MSRLGQWFTVQYLLRDQKDFCQALDVVTGLRLLVNHGLVEQRGSYQEFRLCGELFADWVRQVNVSDSDRLKSDLPSESGAPLASVQASAGSSTSVGYRDRLPTWLHISDFHFKAGDPYESDTVLRALVEAVARLHRGEGPGRAPDVIFATGDIAHSGQPAEYARATAFFDALLRAAGLGKDRLFVIPGNHDVSRNAGAGLQRTLSSESESVAYFAPEAPRYHFNKLASYRKWHDAYFAGIAGREPASAESTCQAVGPPLTVNGIRLGVFAVNTALFCAGDDDHGKLWVGRRPLRAALDRFPFGDVDIRVALLHHPFDWLNDAERSNIREALRANFDVLLRGHLHENDAEAIVGVSGGAVQLAAGAAFQTRAWPNTALLVTAEYDAGRLRVLPLRYEDAPREVWTVAPNLYPTRPGFVGEISVTWKSPVPPPTPPPLGDSHRIPASPPPRDEDVSPKPTDAVVAPESAQSPLGTITTVRELVQVALALVGPPYSEDVILEVCQAIKRDAGLYSAYKAICASRSKNGTNTAIGLLVKSTTKMATLAFVGAPPGEIVGSYSKLEPIPAAERMSPDNDANAAAPELGAAVGGPRNVNAKDETEVIPIPVTGASAAILTARDLVQAALTLVGPPYREDVILDVCQVIKHDEGLYAAYKAICASGSKNGTNTAIGLWVKSFTKMATVRLVGAPPGEIVGSYSKLAHPPAS
jgi:predicted phosphodiesterase